MYHHPSMSRAYQLKQRAQQQAETRQRIIEAAIELHQTLGPRDTTVSDIARHAGVGRVTVYRHFPDELALGLACSGLYYEHNPPPDPGAWEAISTPSERLRTALRDTYAYHRATEAMHTHVLAAGGHPVIMAPYHAHWQHAAEILVAPWKVRGRRRQQLHAAIALALSFEAWRMLVRGQGLDDQQAIEVVMGLAPGDEHP
jgi:AcrR family transcriptional regulator